MGRQIVQQLFMSPRVLGVTAGILILLGVIPGMPHVVFLVIGSRVGLWRLDCCTQRQQATRPNPRPHPPHPPPMARPPGTTCSPSTCWAWSWATA